MVLLREKDIQEITLFLENNQFLPLTSDLVFKVFLENEEELIISILMSFLPLPEGVKVLRVRVLNPETFPDRLQGGLKNKAGKVFILDLKVEFESSSEIVPSQKNIANVEMQTNVTPHLPDRLVAYAGRTHSQQLDRGDGFGRLCPMYSILFTTKNLPVFKDIKDYYHICRIKREGSEDVTFSKSLNFVVVELGKFDKKLEMIDNIRDAWIYLLKHSGQLDTGSCQELSQKGGIMDKAMGQLWKISHDDMLREYEEARQKQRLDQITIKNEAIREGLEKGHREGHREGLEEGLKKGRERQEGVILNMLKMKMDLDIIIKCTGASRELVLELQKKVNV